MKLYKKHRIIISAVCVILIAAVGIGTYIQKNFYTIKSFFYDTAASEDELDEFYNKISIDISELDFTFSSRSLTDEVIGYDGAVRNIVCWGDSMTEGIGASEAHIESDGAVKDISYWTYPYALEQMTGITTYNFGVSGENSEEISVRAGGIKLYTDRDIMVGYRHGADLMVVNENGEPEYVENYGGYGTIYDDYYGAVYINDELYMLTGGISGDEQSGYGMDNLRIRRYYDDTYQSLSEVRDDDIQAWKDDLNGFMKHFGLEYFEKFEYEDDVCVIIPAGTLVTPKAAQDHGKDILIIEMGSNGGWQGDYNTLIAQYDSIIERYNNPYYIIIGDTDDPGDSADANQGMTDSNGNKIGISETYWEKALKTAYGDHFINMREYMITNGLEDAGFITTKRDFRAFQNGQISKKLRADWTHFNSYGYYAKARAVYLKGEELGYWK